MQESLCCIQHEAKYHNPLLICAIVIKLPTSSTNWPWLCVAALNQMEMNILNFKLNIFIYFWSQRSCRFSPISPVCWSQCWVWGFSSNLCSTLTRSSCGKSFNLKTGISASPFQNFSFPMFKRGKTVETMLSTREFRKQTRTQSRCWWIWTAVELVAEVQWILGYPDHTSHI